MTLRLLDRFAQSICSLLCHLLPPPYDSLN
jgi:hypothetical protein